MQPGRPSGAFGGAAPKPEMKTTRTGSPQEAERPGFPFLFGIYGIEPTNETIQHLRETGACGILLLRRNIVDPEQVADLIRNLEAAVGRRLLVAVEHEGGVGNGFSAGMTPFPGAMALGKSGSAAQAYEMGVWMARELRSVGIGVNLAPVLDITGAAYPPRLDTRSFGTSPRTVGEIGASLIRGMTDNGLLSAAKHFPGEGSATDDAEIALPVIRTPAAELEATHMAPFRAAVEAGVGILMTSHACYPALDDAPKTPATFSERIVRDHLRKGAGFKGVVATDDLTMGAIAECCDLPEAAVRAAAAGHDLLVVAHDVAAQKEAVRAYQKALSSGRIPAAAESRARVQRLLDKATSMPSPDPKNLHQSRVLADKVASAAIRVTRDPAEIIPVPTSKRVGIIVPRLREAGTRSVIDEELLNTGAFVQSWLGRTHENAEVLEIPIDPPESETGPIVEWAKEFAVAVFLCCDASGIPGQRTVLQALGSHPRAVAALLFHPWDEPLVPKPMAVLHTYGYRAPQISAVLDMIFHGR